MEAAAARYANFPRNHRGALYSRIIRDDNSPFRDGPDNSHAGRFFAIAISDLAAPVAQAPLDEIIRALPLTDDEKVELANLFVVHMNALQPQPQAGGRKRRRGRKSRRGRKRCRGRSRKN